MQKRSFSVDEKMNILAEAKEEGVSATLRKYNIGSTLYYKWRDKFDLNGAEGLRNTYQRESPEVKQLQNENLRLKRLLADKELEIQVKNDLLKKIAERKKKYPN